MSPPDTMNDSYSNSNNNNDDDDDDDDDDQPEQHERCQTQTLANTDVNGVEDNRQYLFVIRHGDRWDYSNPSWKDLPTSRTGDSPLSTLGHQQARETGTFLDTWLTERNLNGNDVMWLSSPFLRCLQTSDGALNAMQKAPDASTPIPILVEYSIFEWDGHNGSWHSDLPPLEERIHYFPRLDLSYESFFIPSLPEPRSSFLDRCQRSVDIFHQRYPYKPRQVFVMVSHAAGCIALGKAFTKRRLDELTPAGPCSIYMYSRDSNTDVWEIDDHDAPCSMNGYTDHLSDMGTTTIPWNNFGDGKQKFYTGPSTSRFAPNNM